MDSVVCDICEKEDLIVWIDGRTRMGPWANMCEDCYKKHGVGLGTGKGQKYTFRDDEKVKVAG